MYLLRHFASITLLLLSPSVPLFCDYLLESTKYIYFLLTFSNVSSGFNISFKVSAVTFPFRQLPRPIQSPPTQPRRSVQVLLPISHHLSGPTPLFRPWHPILPLPLLLLLRPRPPRLTGDGKPGTLTACVAQSRDRLASASAVSLVGYVPG